MISRSHRKGITHISPTLRRAYVKLPCVERVRRSSRSAAGTPNFEDITSANRAAEFVRWTIRRRQCSGIGATTSTSSAASGSRRSSRSAAPARATTNRLPPSSSATTTLAADRYTTPARPFHQTTTSAHDIDDSPRSLEIRLGTAAVVPLRPPAPVRHTAHTSAPQKTPSPPSSRRRAANRPAAVALIQFRIATHATRRKHKVRQPPLEIRRSAIAPRSSRTLSQHPAL